MKIIAKKKGKNKIVISKKSWQKIGRQAGWIRLTMNESKEPVTIWDFLNDWGQQGYGIALIDSDDKVVDPYVDAGDYPDMILDRSANGAIVLNPKWEGYYLIFHSGQLEGKIGEEYFSKNINKFPQY
jgi:hypothetical protein